MSVKKDSAGVIVYRFENTSDNMTPFFYDITWADDYKDVKRKMGINYFNTRFASSKLLPETLIYLWTDSILMVAKENYSYSMMFDDSGKLSYITVRSYLYLN